MGNRNAEGERAQFDSELCVSGELYCTAAECNVLTSLPPLFQASWKHRGRSFIQLSVFQSSVHYIAFVNRTRWQLNRRTLHLFYIFLCLKIRCYKSHSSFSATYILLPFPKNVLKDNNVNMIWIRKLLSINKKNDQYYIKAFGGHFYQNNHTCICIHTFEKFNQHFLGIECF